MQPWPMQLLIADHRPIVRFGLRQLVVTGWPGVEVVEVGTLDQACAAATAQRFGAVMLEFSMPDLRAGAAIATLTAAAGSGTPVLIFAAASEAGDAARALRSGVAGCLSNDCPVDELMWALRCVCDGRRYVTPAVARWLVDPLGVGAGADPTLPHDLLSTQERRVMLQLAKGRPPLTVGAAMGISARTVGTYRRRIFEKTGWHSNAELAGYCVRHGLLDSLA